MVFILMNTWMNRKSLIETSLPEQNSTHGNLNMRDIADADYMHAKRICKDFEIKDLGEYQDLYLKSDTFLLADVFKNFRKKCLEIYQLNSSNFFFRARIGMTSGLKNPA